MELQRTSSTVIEQDTRQTQFVGRVKWFNTKAGYGFITTLDDEKADIFAHHSSLQVAKEQYRFLVQGEYVEFDMKYNDESSATHKRQATNIRGIQSGWLMCETINENRAQQQTRNTRGDEEESDEEAEPVKTVRPSRPQASSSWTRVGDKPQQIAGGRGGRGGASKKPFVRKETKDKK